MDIESRITSLELSQRLAELGQTKVGMFVYVRPVDEWCITPIITDEDRMKFQHNIIDVFPIEYAPAYTVEEHLAALPHRITLQNGEPFNSFRFKMEKGVYFPEPIQHEGMYRYYIPMKDLYILNYECDTREVESVLPPLRLLSHNMTDENPANTLAKMRIYLLENKLI